MADIEEIRKKVDKLIEEKGLNYRDVSLKIGRKDSYIQQYVRYGYPRRLKEIDRVRLAQILNIDDTEIMDDEVIATKNTGGNKKTSRLLSEFLEANNSNDNSLVRLDVLNPTSTTRDKKDFLANIIGKQFISQNTLEEISCTDPDYIKIVKVISDSMKPTINNGDIIWLDVSYDHPEADGLYMLLNGREPTIMRAQISPIDDSVEISCGNANYKPYAAPNAQAVNVLGKIIYLGQKL